MKRATPSRCGLKTAFGLLGMLIPDEAHLDVLQLQDMLEASGGFTDAILSFSRGF